MAALSPARICKLVFHAALAAKFAPIPAESSTCTLLWLVSTTASGTAFAIDCLSDTRIFDASDILVDVVGITAIPVTAGHAANSQALSRIGPCPT